MRFSHGFRRPARTRPQRVVESGMSSSATISSSSRSGDPRKLGSLAESKGWRVAVDPLFSPEKSDPDSRRFVFTYRVQITNVSGLTATIRRRAWRVVDAVGRSTEIEGEGIVGQQPRLSAGQTFGYSSFCPIETPWGTMEGHYELETDEGDIFEIAIGRFYLVAGEK
jgi:ApaG protein